MARNLPYGWVVNASLAASGTKHPILAARARLELPQLFRVREQLSTQSWVIPWRANLLVGGEALLALSERAWRLAADCHTQRGGRNA